MVILDATGSLLFPSLVYVTMFAEQFLLLTNPNLKTKCGCFCSVNTLLKHINNIFWFFLSNQPNKWTCIKKLVVQEAPLLPTMLGFKSTCPKLTQLMLPITL